MMKIHNIDTFERLKINQIKINDLDRVSYVSYHPKDKNELKNIIQQRINDEGSNCNLNDIDVSNITDMSWLFNDMDLSADISAWDVSNVINMNSMFNESIVKSDISKWDVSNVKSMRYMFGHSVLHSDISKWDVSNVEDMGFMFNGAFTINVP